MEDLYHKVLYFTQHIHIYVSIISHLMCQYKQVFQET